MTNFEDQLLNDLMAKYQPALEGSQLSPRTARRRAMPRPAWLGVCAVGVASAATAAVVVLGGSPAYAAYAVTPHSDGTVTVAVYQASGVAGANARLHALGARVVVVPVRPGCPSISSLPHPTPLVHLSGRTKASTGTGGHRSISVRVRKPGIPAGDTLLLAFTPVSASGPSLGAGGLITGKVPSCVSLPAPPTGSGGTGTAG
jgi:hypothetical protein